MSKNRAGGKSRGKGGELSAGAGTHWRKGYSNNSGSNVDAEALWEARFRDPHKASGQAKDDVSGSGSTSRQSRAPPPPPPPSSSATESVPKATASTAGSPDSESGSSAMIENQGSDKGVAPVQDGAKRVKDEIFEELGRLLDACAALRLSDFDFRVRQHLHALYGSGGRARLQEALSMIRTATQSKFRDSVKNWPAYLLALLKKFDCILASRQREERAQLRKAKAASMPVVLNSTEEDSAALDENDSWTKALAEAWNEEMIIASHGATAQTEPPVPTLLSPPMQTPTSDQTKAVPLVPPPTPPPLPPSVAPSPVKSLAPPTHPPSVAPSPVKSLAPPAPPPSAPPAILPSWGQTTPAVQPPHMTALATAPTALDTISTSLTVAELRTRCDPQEDMEAGARHSSSSSGSATGRCSDGNNNHRLHLQLAAHVPSLHPPYVPPPAYAPPLMSAETLTGTVQAAPFMVPRPPGNWRAGHGMVEHPDAIATRRGMMEHPDAIAAAGRRGSRRQARPAAAPASELQPPKSSTGPQQSEGTKFDFDAWAAQVQGLARQPIAAR